ncbi:MAG: hypothetical protein ACHQZQ_04240 [SAR324 cluster bacterium]
MGSPYEPSVPLHRGRLEDAIRAVRPDWIHVHWLHMGVKFAAVLAAAGLPVTVRAHGFELQGGVLGDLLRLPFVRRVFCFPHQIANVLGAPRLRAMNVAFDTSLFRPHRDKDRRLILRTVTAQPSRDLELFFSLAQRLPRFHFVLALVTIWKGERYRDRFVERWRSLGSPGELLLDVPRRDIIPMVERAGIYLHTQTPPESSEFRPIGMPISIAEAMATGAHVLVRNVPCLVDYVGEAGRAYGDGEQAAALIAETETWDDERWHTAWARSVQRAYTQFADERVLLPLLAEWCAGILGESANRG